MRNTYLCHQFRITGFSLKYSVSWSLLGCSQSLCMLHFYHHVSLKGKALKYKILNKNIQGKRTFETYSKSQSIKDRDICVSSKLPGKCSVLRNLPGLRIDTQQISLWSFSWFAQFDRGLERRTDPLSHYVIFLTCNLWMYRSTLRSLIWYSNTSCAIMHALHIFNY